MITLSLLKYLEDNGFGVVAVKGNEKNASLFWEKMPLDKTGVYIATVGQEQVRGARRSIGYNLYSRGRSDADGYKKLVAIREFLSSGASYENCILPAVENFTDEFKNCTIMPVSTVSSIGSDENGRMIYTCYGTIYY